MMAAATLGLLLLSEPAAAPAPAPAPAPAHFVEPPMTAVDGIAYAASMTAVPLLVGALPALAPDGRIPAAVNAVGVLATATTAYLDGQPLTALYALASGGALVAVNLWAGRRSSGGTERYLINVSAIFAYMLLMTVSSDAEDRRLWPSTMAERERVRRGSPRAPQ